MARVDEIRGLAEFHAESISSSPIDWMNYLDTAAKLYRYPFMDQLLIHLYLIRQKIAFCAPSFQKFFNFFFCLIHRLPCSVVFAMFKLCNFSK